VRQSLILCRWKALLLARALPPTVFPLRAIDLPFMHQRRCRLFSSAWRVARAKEVGSVGVWVRKGEARGRGRTKGIEFLLCIDIFRFLSFFIGSAALLLCYVVACNHDCGGWSVTLMSSSHASGTI
jgi:hypothetical protein